MKRLIKKIIYFSCLITVAPLAALYKMTGSKDLFAGQAQLLSLVPGKIGSHIRIAYYHLVLDKCPLDGYIGFGSFFAHTDVEIGCGVYIGAYCVMGKVKIHDHATIASGVYILSGKNQHGYKEIGKPIQMQPGTFKQISIGSNCWIGNGAIIMANVGTQNVVASGAVIASDTDDYVVVAGNPAALVKRLVE